MTEIKPTMRPIIIADGKVSHWLSCRFIGPNLERSYQKAFGMKVPIKAISTEQSIYNLFYKAQLAKEIYKYKPTHLIFTGHLEHPIKLLMALNSIYKDRRWPKLVFHIYGDFTYYAPGWARSETLLRGKDVNFICASPRHQNQISIFIKNGRKLTTKIPFPTDENKFYYDYERRKELRAKMGLKRDEKVILYAGRLSLQKNITKLTKDIIYLMKCNPGKYRFLLAGNFDQWGAPFFGVKTPLGYYYHVWNKICDEEPELKNRITYLGHKNQQQLFDLYQIADAYVSLSTHHDEDYGVAPVEALFCGCPAVLTSWGGYSAFEKKEDCILTKVRINDDGIVFSSDDFFKKIVNLTSTDSERKRKARALYYKKLYSISAVSRSLPQLLSISGGRFDSFTALIKRLNKRIRTAKKRFLLFPKGSGKRDSFYYEIYRHYAKQQ